MKKTVIHPKGHPAPRGSYSPAILLETGGATLLFATGQLAIDPSGTVVAPHDVAGQTEYVFGLIAAILEGAGMTFADVVKVQTFLTDMADYPQFTAVRDRHFPSCPPASTLIEVKALARPECRIEIEITAAA